MKKTIIICLWLFLTLVMSQPDAALASGYSATVSVDRNIPWKIVAVSCSGWRSKYRDRQDKYVLLYTEKDASMFVDLDCTVTLIRDNDIRKMALYRIVVSKFKANYAQHRSGEKLTIEYPQHSSMPVPFLFK